MLTNLSISNVVLIEHLEIALKEGFSVLTGETGAGKSILLDSLSLALGMRGDTSLIRNTADKASVSAEFDLNPELFKSLQKLLDEHEITLDQSGLILRRVLYRTERSRAFVNDQPISIGLLKRIGDTLLEIHGQFDRLLEPASHRDFLDTFASISRLDFAELKNAVKQAYYDWLKANDTYNETVRAIAEGRDQIDFIHLKIKELETLGAKVGEEDSLAQDLQEVSHYGKISYAIEQALQNLRIPKDFVDVLHTTKKILEKAQSSDQNQLEHAISALDRSSIELIEAVEQLKVLQSKSKDPAAQQQQIEERLHSIRVLSRKFNVLPDELPDYLDKLKLQLKVIEESEELVMQLEKQRKAAEALFLKAAQALSAVRKEAALGLSQAVTKELPDLKLDQARFSVDVKESVWSETGVDRAEFLIASNKGQELSSMTKSASGGELARIMLTLKAILAGHGSIPTIIFDEIDTGVSGSIAAAVGKRLAALGKHIQAIAITHSPQVAATASHHYIVAKYDQGEQMVTTVTKLNDAERREELARMLSGAQITEEARAAAIILLSNKN